MILARALRQLTVASAPMPGRARWISAASGLVVTAESLYVVADDELHLGVFPRHGEGDGILVRLFPGELPHAHRSRKAAKPDLEALTRLPPFEGHAAGALLGLASGSKPQRRTGVLFDLDEAGELAGAPRALDLSALYAALERELPALNIEGVAVLGEELVLLQRGSRQHPVNALVRLPLAASLHAITRSDSLGSGATFTVQPVDLGAIDGVPLCFTDGAALPDGRLVFCAAAENAADTYQDGPVSGSAVGVLSIDGHLLQLERLQPAYKIEGIHAWLDAGTLQLLLVTDADDIALPGWLLSAQLPDAPS